MREVGRASVACGRAQSVVIRTFRRTLGDGLSSRHSPGRPSGRRRFRNAPRSVGLLGMLSPLGTFSTATSAHDVLGGRSCCPYTHVRHDAFAPVTRLLAYTRTDAGFRANFGVERWHCPDSYPFPPSRPFATPASFASLMASLIRRAAQFLSQRLIAARHRGQHTSGPHRRALECAVCRMLIERFAQHPPRPYWPVPRFARPPAAPRA